MLSKEAMTENRQLESEAIKRIARLSPELSAALANLEREWAPKDVPPFIAIGALAEGFISEENRSEHVAAGVLAEIELWIEFGGALAELATVGFLEGILNRASENKWDFGRISSSIGPRSLEFCKEWERFCGCQTVVEAQSRGK